mmetsp:Transcript_23090/g.64430  ORF Transcript_23090/g.64430 Transcript_23090/m.64430 type:complete len:376 (-) Transcript_23090:45-1172(-)
MKKEHTGFYNVTESGLEYKHVKAGPSPAQDKEEFVENFRKGFELNILEQKKQELVFELIGCDASFANALRRILLAEVPTMALENIYMFTNTGLLHDEVLSHRLGLIPLDVDARLFDDIEEGDDATDRNTIVFELKVTCPAKPNEEGKTEDSIMVAEIEEEIVSRNLDLERSILAAAKKSAIETPGRPYTKHVYSRDLVWIPQGDQEDRFPNGINTVYDDILIAKLRPGQSIELEAHARRGIGKDHAKYSPVATACYRLFTEVDLLEPVYDQLAEDLVHIYEPGVFELVPSKQPGTRVEAKVVNPYACTMSRNYMRVPELKKAIQMRRVPDHYVFSIESVAKQNPAILLAEAIRVLQQKCVTLIELTAEQQQQQQN